MERDEAGNSIYFKHISEFESTKQSLNRYESTGEPIHLFQHSLINEIQENTSQSTLDLVINTMGERTSFKRSEGTGETLYGFRPTQNEVRAIAQFGNVTHVGDLVSTKICLRNVNRDDLNNLAHLPFVVEINRIPEPVTPNSVDVSDVTGSSWDQFAGAHGNYTSSSTNIGVVGAGYDSETYCKFASNYAQDIGFDISLSKDFTEESDPFNTTETVYWDDHTTNVADTAGYMLKDGHTHPDLFVSLKIISDGDPVLTDENIRAAIEYATKNNIDVLNMSFGNETSYKCDSYYCEELDSYTTDGVPVAAVGNNNNDSEVEYPANSWLTVGTGGVHKKESGDAVAVSDTEYGDIWFYDRFEGTTYCPWCKSASGQDYSFSPEVYGVSVFNTDRSDSYELDGTSFACPQVAAAAWINFADGGIDSYQDAMNKFKNMGEYEVVNNDEDTDAAKEGDLLEADYFF